MQKGGITMPSMDYIVKMADGTEVKMEVTNTDIPKIDMGGLSGQELESACATLFSNLGWVVKEEQIVTLERGTFRPDLVLSDGDKDYGFVEVVTSMEPKALAAKREAIQVIMDKCKPDLFILTNGVVFDIFYNGKFAGSQTIPPSIETVRSNSRLMAYANAFMKMQNGKKEK